VGGKKLRSENLLAAFFNGAALLRIHSPTGAARPGSNAGERNSSQYSFRHASADGTGR
jgi:hypothetical protein